VVDSDPGFSYNLHSRQGGGGGWSLARKTEYPVRMWAERTWTLVAWTPTWNLTPLDGSGSRRVSLTRLEIFWLKTGTKLEIHTIHAQS
jgi:hypothetical protein